MQSTLIRVSNFFTTHAPVVALGGLVLFVVAAMIGAVVLGRRR